MRRDGFTLIETLIVVTMIGILVAILVPQYKYSVLRSKEAVLKEDLFQMRDAIGKYFYDKKKYPDSLDDLVTGRYLARVPEDPFSHAREWDLIHPEPAEDEEFDPEEAAAVIDVKSLHEGQALDGSSYRDW
jgi:general secretion pathway protein G